MSSGEARPAEVLIAGAGIGGLAAALALARAGARVILVERAPDLAAVGAGLQLSPNASRILRALGVLDAVAARATRPEAIRVRAARGGGTLARIPLDGAESRYGAPYLVARRADLQQALLEAVAAQPAIALRLGTTLAGFGTDDGGGVRATLRHGLLTRTIGADALIGADGIRSEVRARLHGGAADLPQETGRTAWRTMIEASALPAMPPRETGLWLGRDAHLVHYPVDGGRMVNLVAVTRDARSLPSAEMAWSTAGDGSVIAERFAGWHADARTLIAAAPGWATWPLFDRAPLAAVNAGPIALMGDAAHPILPFLAQGAAQAIEDAAALGQAFAEAASAPERGAAAALARYSAARIARAAKVQDTSRRLGRIYHLAGPAAVARDAAMRLLGGKRLLAGYDWLYGG